MPHTRILRSVTQVIAALGDGDLAAGRRELIKLTGRQTQHVTNWLADGHLPKWTYLVVARALEKRGYQLRPALCGLVAPQAKAS